MNELAGRQAGKRRNVESIFFLRLRYLSPSRYIYVCSGYVCFMSCFLYHIHCYSILYPSRMRTHREWMIARLLTKNGAVDILKLEYSVHSKCWCWWMVCTFLRFWFQKTNVAISLCINFTSFEFLPKKKFSINIIAFFFFIYKNSIDIVQGYRFFFFHFIQFVFECVLFIQDKLKKKQKV